MEYDIGDWVIVNSRMVKKRELRRYYVSVPFSKPILGRVVGQCRRFEGKMSKGYYTDESYELGYLEITGSKLFWQVKFGRLNKPVLVSDEGLTLVKSNPIQKLHLPKLFIQQCEWTEQQKKDLSEDSKNWPRDSKGRWVGGNVLNQVKGI